jgi:hypothetical protein
MSIEVAAESALSTSLKWERVHQPAGHDRENGKRTKKQKEVFDAFLGSVPGNKRENQRCQNAKYQ